MRRRLVFVALATSLTLAIAFCVPLALLARSVARDRALEAARRDAQTLAPAVALTDPAELPSLIGLTEAGQQGRLTLYGPDDRVLGAGAPADDAVVVARRDRRSLTADEGGAITVVVPVVDGAGAVWVVRVDVPHRLAERGVARAWLLLGTLGAALVVVSVVLADRLGASTVRAVHEVATTTRRLSDGDRTARVHPGGPLEVQQMGIAVNELAGRIDELVAHEREVVADMSHRLRTPLTALRLTVERMADVDGELGDRLRFDVDELTAMVDHVIHEARRPISPTRGAVSDLVAVVAARAAFWEALADDQGRPWHVQLPAPGTPLWVGIEERDLTVLVDVLLDNVMSHTPDGTPTTVSVRRREGTAALVVADDGPGFSATVLTRGSSGSGSTGLGLDIARRTVEQAHGQLILSTPAAGRGAVVTAEFPLVSRTEPSEFQAIRKEFSRTS